MKGIITAVALTFVVGGGQLHAQESDVASGVTEAAESILRAILLPEAADRVREAGVPTEEVRRVLDEAREARVQPGEAQEVLSVAESEIREHGPVENFGAFVQERLTEGLRGQELAAAIRAEHEARGIGKGRMLHGPDEGSRRGQGGPPEGRGRPNEAGAAGDAHQGDDGPTPEAGNQRGSDDRDAARRRNPGGEA